MPAVTNNVDEDIERKDETIEGDGADNTVEWHELRPPRLKRTKKIYLWATYYSIRTVRNVTKGGVHLRSIKGKPLGAALKPQDFCNAAMEGTVRVKYRNGRIRTFGFSRMGEEELVDCTPFYPRHRPLGRARFHPTKEEYGKSASGTRLIPYRSIATDPRVLPPGSVIFIPEARGTTIDLPSGKQVKHDGYFFACDSGGVIVGRHIDIFLGNNRKNPFRFATGKYHQKFKAYYINRGEAKEALELAHVLEE